MDSRSDHAGERLLLTGLIGFTGGHLVPALDQRGYTVFDLDCEIRDKDAVQALVQRVRPQVVLHLAGIANVAHGDVTELYTVNVVGTRNLLAALAELPEPPRNTVVAGSATVYGNTPPSPITEDNRPDPRNDYGVSKQAVEELAKIWSDLLPITVVRPFNYTGPGQTTHFVIPKIVDHFARRTGYIELGNTNVVREYGDVRRTVEAYCRLAAREGDGETYNIATGRGVTLQNVIDTCAEITGHHMDVRVNPAFVRPNEVYELIGSRHKIESALGTLPEYSLRETLAWMLQIAEGG